MRPSLSILTVLAALLAPMTLHAPTAQAATAAQGATTTAESGTTARVIVRLKADSPLLRRQALAADAMAERHERARALGTRFGRVMRAGGAIDARTQVVLADGMTSAQLAAELAGQADIESVSVDQRRRRLAVPNDPLYTAGPVATGPAVGQWYLKPPSASAVSSIDAQSAWDLTVGSPSIVVAVLDTGVRFEHPDLGANLLPGYDFISDAPTANDGNGRDADASDQGDFLTSTELNTPGGPFYGGAPTNCSSFPAPYPAENSSWHGTQTAGLIGAITGNGIGMASVGRTVRVLPVRVLGKCGGFDSDIIAGMRWAAGLHVDGVPDNTTPARVINLSLGGEGACNQAYTDAVAEVNAVGAVVVASAGNSTGHAVNVPANCPGVIGVGGLRNVGTKVGFSDLGPEVAISAPAGNCVNTTGPCLYPILTTSNSGTQGPGTSIWTDSNNISVGTSFSAPLVAGTAALMLSLQPALTPAEVKAKLQSTARAFPTTGATAGVPQCTAPQFDSSNKPIDQVECYCTTSTCGAGMLDAGKAVLAAAGVQAHIDVSPAVPQPSQTVTLSAAGSQAATGRTIVSYAWTLTDGGGIVSGFNGPTNASTATLTPTGTGTFTVRLTVTDSQASSSSVSSSVTVQPADSGGGGGGALGLPWLLLLALAIPLVAAGRRREG